MAAGPSTSSAEPIVRFRRSCANLYLRLSHSMNAGVAAIVSMYARGMTAHEIQGHLL